MWATVKIGTYKVKLFGTFWRKLGYFKSQHLISLATTNVSSS